MVVYTTPEVAAICRVSVGAVAAWIDDGLLDGYRLPGGRRRVTRPALLRFLERYGMPTDLLPEEEPPAKEEQAAAR